MHTSMCLPSLTSCLSTFLLSTFPFLSISRSLSFPLFSPVYLIPPAFVPSTAPTPFVACSPSFSVSFLYSPFSTFSLHRNSHSSLPNSVRINEYENTSKINGTSFSLIRLHFTNAKDASSMGSMLVYGLEQFNDKRTTNWNTHTNI